MADGLGIALPRTMPRSVEPPPSEVMVSPALSLSARPGDGDISGRRVAILIGPGVDDASIKKAEAALLRAGAVVRRVAAHLNAVETANRKKLEPDATFETMPSVLFDAVVVPDGAEGLEPLGQSQEFLRDQYRHCKPILFLGSGGALVADAGIPTDDDSDWAMVQSVDAFVEALSKHRNWTRATDPPIV